MRKIIPESVRFFSKVNKNGPLMPLMKTQCHEWTAGCFPEGYGLFNPKKYQVVSAHRWAYERIYGPLKSIDIIHHRCRNRRCVRLGHLQKVTSLTHPDSLGAINAAKTHCMRGHPLPGKKILDGGQWRRRCQICHREQERQRKHA